MERPRRRPNRLKDFDYSGNGMYFVTVCTEKQTSLFWMEDTTGEGSPVGANCVRPPEGFRLSAVGRMAAAEIERWPEIYPGVRAVQYVIMPNHLHILLEIGFAEDGRTQFAPTGKVSLSRIIQQFKGAVSKKAGRPLWQKGFYESVIRSEQHLLDTWQYIVENPRKWADDEYYT